MNPSTESWNIWLPNSCPSKLITDLFEVLADNNYSTRLEIAARGRGRKMRIVVEPQSAGLVLAQVEPEDAESAWADRWR